MDVVLSKMLAQNFIENGRKPLGGYAISRRTAAFVEDGGVRGVAGLSGLGHFQRGTSSMMLANMMLAII